MHLNSWLISGGFTCARPRARCRIGAILIFSLMVAPPLLSKAAAEEPVVVSCPYPNHWLTKQPEKSEDRWALWSLSVTSNGGEAIAWTDLEVHWPAWNGVIIQCRMTLPDGLIMQVSQPRMGEICSVDEAAKTFICE